MCACVRASGLVFARARLCVHSRISHSFCKVYIRIYIEDSV
jgi:hypothetical protein